ncbi:alpha/beta hydrolase family esterase [Nocardia sp. bgisy134]|uniref:alpha/beta hydrolase family esterase n=1 Tax=unclassified Nocardia TaxID=2637762 RepID=UPI003D7052CA
MSDLNIVRSEWTITSAARQRRYLMLQPQNQSSASLPVVIDLHGSGIAPEDHLRITDAQTLATQAIVIAPEGAIPFTVAESLPPATAWNVPGIPMPGETGVRPDAGTVDDVAFIGHLIDDVVERQGADPARIHLRGYSGGARLASHIAAALPHRIASIGCIAGVRFPPRPSSSMPPLLAIHGRQDPFNPFDGGTDERWCESVEYAVGRWADHWGCHTRTERMIDDGVHEIRYERVDGSSPVRLIIVEEAEHSWPGTSDRRHIAAFGEAGAFSASTAYWRFVEEVEQVAPTSKTPSNTFPPPEG